MNSILKNFLKYFIVFFRTTTIHGLGQIVRPRRHWLETLFWTISVITCVILTVMFVSQSWERYRTKPTVVAIEKDFREWNTTLPATTLCFLKKLDVTKARIVIEEEWKITNGEKFDFYLEFLNDTVKIDYENIENFKKYQNEAEQLDHLNLQELMVNVNLDLKVYRLTTYLSPDNYYHRTLTEMGICYSFNSYITPYLQPLNDKLEIEKALSVVQETPPQCNYLNAQCYGRLEELRTAMKYYVHSAYDLPDSISKYNEVPVGYEKDATYNVLSTIVNEELKTLDVQQRGCNLIEDQLYPESPMYSYNLCKMNCRRRKAMKLCQCVPHFYVPRIAENEQICNVSGLICLSRYAKSILRLDKTEDFKCECLQACSEINYFPDKVEWRKWQYPTNETVQMRWAIESFSTTRLKRVVIYGFDDLLVSFGGAAGLFLGCSIISGVETLYFFTLRAVRYVLCSKKKPQHLKPVCVQQQKTLTFTHSNHNVKYPLEWNRYCKQSYPRPLSFRELQKMQNYSFRY